MAALRADLDILLSVRDIPGLARNTALFGAGAALAALGVGYELRRRNRQTFLYPLGGRIGLYRGNMYKYSFSPAEMLRVRLDFFGWIVVVCKLLLPMLLLMDRPLGPEPDFSPHGIMRKFDVLK